MPQLPACPARSQRKRPNRPVLRLDLRPFPAGKIAAIRRDRQGSESRKNQHHADLWHSADFSLAFLLGVVLYCDALHIAIQDFLNILDVL